MPPTLFEKRVYNVCKCIPKGKLATYKDIANALNTGAYRAVGNALNKNPNWPKVPCHRVVNSDGRVGGFARGKGEKINLLKQEGIEVKHGKISNLSQYLVRLRRKR